MITCIAGFEDQIRKFVAKKHGMLHRQAWLSEVNERQSILGHAPFGKIS